MFNLDRRTKFPLGVWRCRRLRHGCHAYIKTFEDTVHLIVDSHNHSPVFVTNRRGNKAIQYQGWTFNSDRRIRPPRAYYRCSAVTSGCHAIIKTLEDTVVYRERRCRPTFMKTKFGKPVIQIDSFRFNMKRSHGPRSYWACNKASQGCRATLITLEDIIVKTRNEHSHV
ncbi:hypothetical protein JYU34_004430 [Plutella xylostella]|uniref:FLYWCH-type domain-containing protein n=1 Tax=Plutella xylostella TaxID=51655 RepID=A0ABQ7QXZ2_PLUXY|nr:hypothetical protein JYU34_004430 [Plutella xylostella]